MIYGDTNNTGNPSLYSIMQSTNLYVYCINNPIIYFDSSGRVVEILYHKVSWYNHIDIAINDTVYSFANYGVPSDACDIKKAFAEGYIMVTYNKDAYIEKDTRQGKVVTGFVINFSLEEEQNLENALKGYIANSVPTDLFPGKQSTFEPLYYRGKRSDYLNFYIAFNIGSPNCVGFVMKALMESGLYLYDEKIISPFIILPDTLQNHLIHSNKINQMSYMLLDGYIAPKGSVLEVNIYEKNPNYYNNSLTGFNMFNR